MKRPITRTGSRNIYRGVQNNTVHRVSIALFAFIFAFFLIIYRLCDIVMVYDKKPAYYSGNSSEHAPFKRAEIIDRHGVLLAVNLLTASLHANPSVIDQPKQVAASLHQLFPELDKERIEKRLSSGKQFVWIKRNLSPREQYAVNRLGIPGLAFEREEKRVYPQGRLFSHLLGYVGIDGEGLAGLEKQYDQQLLLNHQPLQLSLDARLQTLMHTQLSYAMEEFQAKGAAGIIMDAQTGELLAMTSLPDFDPHHPALAKPEEKFNRATLGMYEMGSTFKIFTMAAGLDTNVITVNDLFDVSKPIRQSGFSIRDSHPEDGVMSVPQIFMQSSNIGTAKIAQAIGVENQKEYFRRLGLFDELHIELPEKGKPIIPERWPTIRLMTTSYGHGIAVSLTHVVKAVAATVNGGRLQQATLLKREKDFLHSVVEQKNTVISQETSEMIRRLLFMVVEKGTGSRARVDGYLVGGKTGTAEKPSKGIYDKKAMISSFVGVFPVDQPQYVIAVMLDEPVGTKQTYGYATGGMTAAPVVGNVIREMGPMMLIKRQTITAPDIEKFVNFSSDEKSKDHYAAF